MACQTSSSIGNFSWQGCQSDPGSMGGHCMGGHHSKCFKTSCAITFPYVPHEKMGYPDLLHHPFGGLLHHLQLLIHTSPDGWLATQHHIGTNTQTPPGLLGMRANATPVPFSTVKEPTSNEPGILPPSAAQTATKGTNRRRRSIRI